MQRSGLKRVTVVLMEQDLLAQGSDIIRGLQQGLPAGHHILHPLLSQAIGLAVFHVLFEIGAVVTLEPDASPEIQWNAQPPQEALQFLDALAICSGKIVAAAAATPADLAANNIIPEILLPVPAGFVQPTSALLHEFAVQMLLPDRAPPPLGLLRLYPAMNTIKANRWWPELLERVCCCYTL